jgi:hypothetical protein
VIPFSVERVALQSDLFDLLIGDLAPFGLLAGIDFGTDLNAGSLTGTFFFVSSEITGRRHNS